jgi:uncharacterized membrane protein YoaK (UPF0700 family)
LNEALLAMISKLPRWVWAGAWALAFVAGMVNVVGLLGFQRQAITHLTGTTSLLGAAIAELDFTRAKHLLLMILSFLGGTVISGMLIPNSALQLGRRYGAALFLESIMLSAAVPLFKHHAEAGAYIASCACGLQNAMVSTYSGAVVRTTHLSGMFTDLGIFLGQVARRAPVDIPRLKLCFLVISGFLCGGIAGGFAFHRMGYNTLFVPSALTGVTAVAYGIYRSRKL